MDRFSPEAMRARVAAYNANLDARLARGWSRSRGRHETFVRFDGTRVLVGSYEEFEAEVERYARESGGLTPPCATPEVAR